MTRHGATAVGILLVVAHAFLLALLLDQCRRDPLTVRVTAAPAASGLAIRAELPASIFARVAVAVDGQPGDLASAQVGPGMHRVDWSLAYAGGFERSVGVTQLVGPFQQPEQPPCSARLIVGQSFVDDGHAGPGTVAHLAKRIIEEEFAGFEQWPVGKFEGVAAIRLSWRRAFSAFLAIEIELAFSRGRVPISVALIPRLENGVIDLEARVTADVDADSRVYQWIADLFDADDIASATAEQEIRASLRNAFAPPPPVPLPGGRELRFEYCNPGVIDILPGHYAAIPLAMRMDGARSDILPVSLGPTPSPRPVLTKAPLALEFELDAINNLLYYLWRTGYLDQELDRAGLDERFNRDSTVQELLSIRVGDIDLALPPTASNSADPRRTFDLGAAATLAIRDGATTTRAHLYGSIGFDFVGGDSAELVAKLWLRDLALTCEPSPGILAPCYSDLVRELRGRSDDLHGELTRLFTDRFNQIVLARDLGTKEMMATFAIERAEVYARQLAPTGVVRVDLYGHLRE